MNRHYFFIIVIAVVFIDSVGGLWVFRTILIIVIPI